MLIKDIRYRKLKELAKRHVKDQSPHIPDKDIPNQDLSSRFNWGVTSQGCNFWSLVDNENYKEARKIFDWDKQDDGELLKVDDEFSIIFKDLEHHRKNPRQFDIDPILEHSSTTDMYRPSLLNKNDATSEVFNPQPHYDNSKPGGSLYKVATERGWNAYLFDVVKRIERGGKKENNPLRQEIEKSIDVFKIWLNELPNE